MAISAPTNSSTEDSFVARLRRALPLSTMVFVLGVLVIQMAFITSYIGAFHRPTPHNIEVEVVAPSSLANGLVARLNAISGEPLEARAISEETSAVAALRQDRTAAVFVPDLAKPDDTLLVASAGGAAQASAVEAVFQQAETAEHRSLEVRDLVPFQSGDGRGLSAFYLVVGWLIGGYLLATLFGITHGRPTSLRLAAVRLGATVPYAVLSGLGGALIIGPVLGALDGHFAAVAGVGALLVLAAATVAIGLQALFGTVGVGIVLIIFVVLGNPSAGGPYQASLLPAFWRVIGGALPNGAGVTTIRQITYFGAYGITTPLLIICVWMIGGVALTMVATSARSRLRAGRHARPI